MKTTPESVAESGSWRRLRWSGFAAFPAPLDAMIPGVAVGIAVVGNAHGPAALPDFSPLFFMPGLGGLLTTLISLAIDARPEREPVQPVRGTTDGSSSGGSQWRNGF